MRVSKLIPLLIMFLVVAISLNVGFGSFATQQDFAQAQSDRSSTFPSETYILKDDNEFYEKLKVSSKREEVMNILEQDGFIRLHERTIGSHHGPIGIFWERDAHNIIIMAREVANSHDVEAVEVIFRNERFFGKLREGLAHTPKVYKYEKL